MEDSGKQRCGSRILQESREVGRRNLNLRDPGERMEMAFAMSLDACALLLAGLMARGFSESDALATMAKKRK
jgi:hypothetical protein